MIDDHDVREMLHRRADAVPAMPAHTSTAVRRARRRLVLNGAVATVAAAAIGVATFAGVDAIRSAPIPADRLSEELGIFAPVSGRIVYVNDGVGSGYDPGIWAVDPSGPSDTTEGPSVADDVASTLVPLDLEKAPRDWSNGNGLQPLGWSSDGTELLVTRWEGFEGTYYVLHADGTETRVPTQVPNVGAATATISPDGSYVAFEDEGLAVVDVEGGRAVKLPYPADGEPSGPLSFSPDGTQIAYLAEDEVWVVNADGTDAHKILANEETRKWYKWFSGMQWSPAGDRIAIGLGGDPAIYTFAPDGSDFTKVITGGVSPFWSPDGSQIAYTIPCEEHPDDSCPVGSPLRSLFDPQPGDPPAGLAIADADGSNVRVFGFAASGPWHPGASPSVAGTTEGGTT